MKKVKCISYLICIVVLEIFSVLLGYAVQILKKLSECGENIDLQLFQAYYMLYLMHPVQAIKEMINDKNPIFFALCIGSFILAFYMVNKTPTKGYKIETSYAVHGSSRFALYSEIVKKDELVAIPISQLNKNMQKSLLQTEETSYEAKG